MPLTGDGYLAGEYPGGTTTVEGAPVSATVLVYQRDSGQLIAQTESSQSGEWIVTGVDISKAHDIVGRKEGFNDVIVSNVMPTSMVDIAYTGEILPNETFTGALGYLELVGGIPPYAASVVDPLPAGLFPVVNGRQLIIDGTTTDDDVFNSTVRITSSNGATKDVPVKLVVGFKAPANFEAETLEDAGAFSVVLTWEVTNTTQEVLVFKSATPFDLESMPAPIATLTGDAVSYTDDDVIGDDVFYYMAASVCEGFTLYSDEVREVVAVGDPHWDKVVALLHFDGDLTDETGASWSAIGAHSFASGRFDDSAMLPGLNYNYLAAAASTKYDLPGDFTIEAFIKPSSLGGYRVYLSRQNDIGGNLALQMRLNNGVPEIVMRGHGAGVVTLTSAGGDVTTGAFTHIAAAREDGYVRLFVNGVIQAAGACNFDLSHAGGPRHLLVGAGDGNNPGSGSPYHGAIDELRITKGVARYTENFTPPTEPFPNK